MISICLRRANRVSWHRESSQSSAKV